MRKSAIITAGAAGIGAAIAERFIHDGMQVHIVDIDEEACTKFRSTHPAALVSNLDVSDAAAIEDAVDQHLNTFSGIDTLVNCAGIAGPTAPVEDVLLEDWQACFAVNMEAAFLFCKAIVPSMKISGAGNIINVSSTAGWHGYPLRTPYASSKWALIGFTRSIAMELGQYGIRANVICPGSIQGDRMDRVIAAEAKTKGISEQLVRDSYTQSNSLKTFIDATDIADMAAFLASSDASRITGQVMNVDGHLESFA